MQEMNDVVKKFLTGALTERPLEKNIYVVDAPPKGRRH
jgi:hypothetical protein